MLTELIHDLLGHAVKSIARVFPLHRSSYGDADLLVQPHNNNFTPQNLRRRMPDGDFDCIAERGHQRVAGGEVGVKLRIRLGADQDRLRLRFDQAVDIRQICCDFIGGDDGGAGGGGEGSRNQKQNHKHLQ